MKIAAGRAKKSTRPPDQRAGGRTPDGVADILFISVTIAFIAVCVAYVHWCDRIIGPDDGDPDAVTQSSIERGAPEHAESGAVPA